MACKQHAGKLQAAAVRERRHQRPFLELYGERDYGQHRHRKDNAELQA